MQFRQLRLWSVLFTLLTLALAAQPAIASAAPASAMRPDELRRIERLIEIVELSTDRAFIRNGTSYDAATAGRFLRLKWDHFRDRVHTVEDFIREIGSRSGTSGPRYRVRNADGSEEDAATFLDHLLSSQVRSAAN